MGDGADDAYAIAEREEHEALMRGTHPRRRRMSFDDDDGPSMGSEYEVQGQIDEFSRPRRGRVPLRQVATLKNLRTLSLLDMLKALRPYLVEEIPEGVMNASQEEMYEIDRQIGRLANTVAYIAGLYAFASALAREAKAEGRTEEWHDFVAMKDALYEIRGAVKLKWQACSRLITVDTEVEREPFERPNYQRREQKADTRRASRGAHLRGWGGVA